MKAKMKHAVSPEWALHITALRERLEINQAELARRMQCSAMTISRWERGLLQPSAEHFIQLGNLGNKHEAWFFWEMAGIQPAKVVDALSGSSRSKRSFGESQVMAGSSRNLSGSLGIQNLTSVPVLKAVVGTHDTPGDRRSSLRSIATSATLGVPSSWCPNPSYTSLLRLRGRAMEPLIRHGDLLAVDSFRTERGELVGQLVVAASTQTGLFVGRLRRYQTLDLLEAETPKFEAVVLDKATRSRIIGKVLWWISSEQPISSK